MYNRQLRIFLDYLGCYVDQSNRDLHDYWQQSSMSPRKCIQRCSQREFKYAGVQVYKTIIRILVSAKDLLDKLAWSNQF